MTPMNTSPSRPITKTPDATAQVMQQVRQVAEEKYPRRLPLLARRCGWTKSKAWRVLYDSQTVRLAELVTLCTALGLPLSQLLHSAGA